MLVKIYSKQLILLFLLFSIILTLHLIPYGDGVRWCRGIFWFTVFYDNVDDDYDDFDDYKIVCYWIQQSCSRMPLFVVMSMLRFF